MWAEPPQYNKPLQRQLDPTELSTRILWEDPPAAAAFLGLDLGGEAVALDEND